MISRSNEKQLVIDCKTTVLKIKVPIIRRRLSHMAASVDSNFNFLDTIVASVACGIAANINRINFNL